MVNMPEDGFSLQDSTVAIIGLGLMGGSLALALKKHCRAIYGIDSHRATLELASLKTSLIVRMQILPNSFLRPTSLS